MEDEAVPPAPAKPFDPFIVVVAVGLVACDVVEALSDATAVVVSSIAGHHNWRTERRRIADEVIRDIERLP